MAIPIGLTSEAQKKFLVSLATSGNISVRWERYCNQPKATITKQKRCEITLPPPSGYDEEFFWFLSFHELSHVMEKMHWSYFELIKHLNFEDKLVCLINNLLMDVHCEKAMFGKFDRIDQLFSIGRYLMHTGKADLDLKKNKGVYVDPLLTASTDPIDELFLSLFAYTAECRQKWMGHPMEALDMTQYRGIHKDFYEAFDKLSLETRMDSILQSPGQESEIQAGIVLDLLKLIGYTPPPPSGQGSGKGKSQEGQGKSQEGQGKSQEGQGQSQGNQGGEGEPKEGQGEGQDGQGEGQGEQNKDGSGSEKCDGTPDSAFDHNQGEHGGQPTNAEGNEKLIDAKWEMKDKNITASQLEKIKKALVSKMTAPMEETKVEKHGGNRPYIPYPQHDVIDISEKRVGEYQKEAIITAIGHSTVSKQVAKYLQTMSVSTYSYGQVQGKIHSKNVHRVYSGNKIPGATPRIFKKKDGSRLNKNSAVELLLDCSGSMSGSKYAIGSACVVALNETLTALQIEHEILGFTSNNRLITYVFKPYGKRVSKETMTDIMSSQQVNMHYNCDGDSILYAAERLLNRKEDRKLLIVLSDGSPCGANSGNADKYLKKVCNDIETKTPIDLVGIGVTTDVVKRYYKHHCVVNDPEDLDMVLFNVLKEFLV